MGRERRKRKLNTKKARLVVKSVAYFGFACGLVLIAVAISPRNFQLVKIGIAYMLASMLLICVHGVMKHVSEIRRSKRAKIK